jgi:REP element-mobilizing transposase RayT
VRASAKTFPSIKIKIMLNDYGFEKYEENEFPLAYLITIRTFGTWLHGDERHSVDRWEKNVYGTPDIAPNEKLRVAMRNELKQEAILLNNIQRKTVERAITELSARRRYSLQAINVRTNHVHAVVSAQIKPERIADAFKAFATKKLREEELFSKDLQIWSRGRSRRYLWKPKHVAMAIDYVLYGQGDVPFEGEDYTKPS